MQEIRLWFQRSAWLLGLSLLHEHGGGDQVLRGPRKAEGVLPPGQSNRGPPWDLPRAPRFVIHRVQGSRHVARGCQTGVYTYVGSSFWWGTGKKNIDLYIYDDALLSCPPFFQFRVDDKESKVTIGYFFLDMHPRDGKYGHAAIFDLQPSCIGEDQERQVKRQEMMIYWVNQKESEFPLLC